MGRFSCDFDRIYIPLTRFSGRMMPAGVRPLFIPAFRPFIRTEYIVNR